MDEENGGRRSEKKRNADGKDSMKMMRGVKMMMMMMMMKMKMLDYVFCKSKKD